MVLDASVLLDLYEYSGSVVEDTFAVLEHLAADGRIWLPHQAALEYQRGRAAVIVSQETDQYDIAQATLDKLRKLKSELQDKLGQHAYLDPDSTLAVLDAAVEQYQAHIREARAAHPNLREADPIRDRLDVLYDGSVGGPLTEDEMSAIMKLGKERYEQEVPPGYGDKDKPNHRRYGDLIFWRQVLEHAAQESASVIVVTNDSKDDWWTKPKGRIFGPRPELLAEFHRETGRRFYMYSHDRFMNWAAHYLEIGVEQESIDQIRDVRETKDASERANALYEQLYGESGLAAALARLSAATGSVRMPDYSLASRNLAEGLITATGQLKVPDYGQRVRDLQYLTPPDLTTDLDTRGFTVALANAMKGRPVQPVPESITSIDMSPVSSDSGSVADEEPSEETED